MIPNQLRATIFTSRIARTVGLLVLVLAMIAACGNDGETAETAATSTPAATAATAATPEGNDNASDTQLQVIATTPHIADMARNVAGDRATVESIMPPTADPHEFEPAPRDVERVADADLVLQHGLELDGWAEQLVSQSGTEALVRTVTEGIETIEGGHLHDDDHGHEDEHVHDDHGHEHEDGSETGTPTSGASRQLLNHGEGSDDHDHGDQDPHVWFDVANARMMVEQIRDALIEVDPDGQAMYEQNADIYLAELDVLDEWIREQIATIPEADRKLVTSHDAFGYYVHTYGLEFIGAVIPSLDTQAQPSAQEAAALIDLIQEEHVKAIFVEASVSPALAEQIAAEAGVEVVDGLYGDTLGEPGSGAETYIDMMRWNTTLIVEALSS